MWLGCALRPIGWTRLQRSAPQFTRCVQAGVPLQTCLFLSSKLNFIWSFGKTFTPKKEKLQEADGERGRGCSKRNDNLITTTLHWLGACWGNLLCQALSIEARLSERTKRFTFFYVKEKKMTGVHDFLQKQNEVVLRPWGVLQQHQPKGSLSHRR